MAQHILCAIGIGLMLAGCGTTVPEIQENPRYPDPERLVVAVVGSIHCELRNAITYVINSDRSRYWDHGWPLEADWLNNWGAQIQITLTIDEQSSLSPSGLYFPTKIFSLFGGASVSSDAVRTDTLNYYYTVKELYRLGKGCAPNTIASFADHPTGSLLIQSDLKLKEWLLSVVQSQAVGDISITANNKNAKNAITHQVTFKIISSGNITPTWKLVHATINPTVPLFLASRSRTHDLLITFGPNVEAPDGSSSLGVGTPAAGANLAAQIGIATSSQMINNRLP
jgi:hypothetical protein